MSAERGYIQYSSRIHILVLVAGTNEPSNSHVLASKMADAMRLQEGVTVEKIRLKDLQIAHFGLECYGPHCPIDDLELVKNAIAKADGVVIASPIWNFSIPGHLKNLIDRMGAFGLDQESHSIGMLHSKPFYLLLTGGTPLSVWPLMKRTTSHLTVSLQYFGAAVLGTHFEPRCMLERGVFGLVVDARPKSIVSVQAKGLAFLQYVQTFQRTGLLPLKYRIIQHLIRVAQKIKKKLMV